MKSSANNVFAGTVTNITKGAKNAEVTLTLKGGASLVATVTKEKMDHLGLGEAMQASATIKPSSVLIGSGLPDAKADARNVLCGTVAELIEGPVTTEVTIDFGSGNTISAVVAHESCEESGLKTGAHACALFKASSVTLGATGRSPRIYPKSHSERDDMGSSIS